MRNFDMNLTRRTVVLTAPFFFLLNHRGADATEEKVVTVYKDPNCGCCSRWVQHLKWAGFETKVIETSDINAVKAQFGVPTKLASCHTAQVSEYVIEGHVPAAAIRRLLSEKPTAIGLAVAGMPSGAPGMEGASPERYDVVLFGPKDRTVYMHFIGQEQM